MGSFKFFFSHAFFLQQKLESSSSLQNSSARLLVGQQQSKHLVTSMPLETERKVWGLGAFSFCFQKSEGYVAKVRQLF